MSPLYVGIDPGVKGALAVVGPGPPRLHLLPVERILMGTRKATHGKRKGERVPKWATEYRDADLLALLLSIDAPALCLVEKPPSFMGDKPSQRGAGKRQEGYGLFRGLLTALGWNWAPCSPGAWKRATGIAQARQKVPKDETPEARDARVKAREKAAKATAVAKAQALFPSTNLVLPGCRVPHDGLAEALLLAYWAATRD